MKQRILFICTHNSARSQMAEGLLRALGGEQFEAYSAGTEATQVRSLAIRAMAERSRSLSDLSQGETTAALVVSRSLAGHWQRGRAARRLPPGA